MFNNPIWRTTDPRHVIYEANGINGYCVVIANRRLVGNVVTWGVTVLRKRKRQLNIFDHIMKKGVLCILYKKVILNATRAERS